MPDDPVLYAVADGVATISMHQPDTRNALSDELLDGLIAAFERARDDDAVRAVVLASTTARTSASSRARSSAARRPSSSSSDSALRVSGWFSEIVATPPETT